MGFSYLALCFGDWRDRVSSFVSIISIKLKFYFRVLHNFINKCYIQIVEKLSPKSFYLNSARGNQSFEYSEQGRSVLFKKRGKLLLS